MEMQGNKNVRYLIKSTTVAAASLVILLLRNNILTITSAYR
jgi:hypothetical protein